MGRFSKFTGHDLHPDDVRMTLGEHLEELRSRVVRALLALGVGAILCYVFIDNVMGLLTSPVFAVYHRHGIDPTMLALSPAEMLLTDLKVSMIVGFILSAPYSIWQVWGFVAAGLYKNERRWVYRFAPASVALFFTGVLFLFFIVSPLLLDFLLTYRQNYPNYDWAYSWVIGHGKPLQTEKPDTQWPTTQPVPAFDTNPTDPPEMTPWVNLKSRELLLRIGEKNYRIGHLQEASGENRIDPTLRLADTIVFMLQLAAAFGISFQVPVIVAFVATVGIASSSQVASLRRYIWLVMCIAAAVITPTTDLVTLFLLLGPMMALLEVGILAARMIEKGRAEEST